MTDSVFKIDESQLFSYIKCPTYYDAVYNKKLPFNPIPSMNKLLNQVANAFYINLMNGKVLSLADLKSKWDSVCERNKNIITEAKCLEGLGLLNKMYLWAKAEQLRIADLSVPYTFVNNGKFGTTEFSGAINCIALNKNNQLELLITDFSLKYPNQNMLDMKLKYSLDAYAFKLIYKKDIYIRLHNVKNNKDFLSYRNQDDFNRVTSSIDSVGYSIRSDLYYPRETSFCVSCEMKTICKAWHN